MRHQQTPTARAGLLPIATASLALVIFVADALTPPDCVVSGLYVVVVLMAGRFCRGPVLWRICLGCGGLTVLAQFLANRLVLENNQAAYIGAFNTLVSILAIGLSGYLIIRGQAAETALQRSQADLAHVSRVTTMGELTASIAHEVNQPIAGIVANASACLRWLAGDIPDLGEARAAATRIVRDGTRAAEIISRIRQIFIKGSPQRQLTNINLLVQDTIDLLGSEASRYGVSVKTDLSAELPLVLADPVQLQQVVVNLVTNAIDAMKDAAEDRALLAKSWQIDSGHIALSISDQGAGLPAGDPEQIFKAFFTTKAHGTGMGLSISQTIVEAHRGVLSATPNIPRGTTFQVTLPVTAQDMAQ